MRNSIIITLLILVAGYFLISYQSITREKNKATTLEQPKKQNSIENPKNEIIKENTKKKTIATPVSDEVSQELSQQNYSAEPFIEAISVFLILTDCLSKRYLNYKTSQTSEKYETQFLKSQEKCNESNNKYPNISNIWKNKDFENIFMKLAIQSDYRDFFQKSMASDFLSDEEKQALEIETIKLITTSKIAPIIQLLGDIPLTENSQPYYNQLFAVLGSLNTNYTKLILSQSSILFSCQYNQGMTCSPTSSYMLKQCVENDAACGIDVQTWFQTHNTPAHNRDISKLVEFFESQVQQ